jgi:hypothetical protein
MAVTETTVAPEAQDESSLPVPVQDAIKNARAAKERVEEISARLNLAANVTDAVRRNEAANQLVRQYKNDEEMKTLVEGVVTRLGEKYTDDEQFVAVYTTLIRALHSKYNKKNPDTKVEGRVRSFLDQKAKDIPAEPLSDADKEALTAERMTQAELYKAYKGIVKAMGKQLPADLQEDITVRRGGPRGPEVVGSYVFNITLEDGSKGADLDKISTVANNAALAKLNWSTADLKNHVLQTVEDASLSEDGKKLTLPASFEFTLPDPVNRKVTAQKTSDVSAPDEEEGEDEETSEEELES